MKGTPRVQRMRTVAAATGLVLLMSACGGGGGNGEGTDTPAPPATTASSPTDGTTDPGTDGTTDPSAAPSTSDGGDATPAPAGGGIITANGTEPQNPLLPAATNETGGGRMMDLLFRGLVRYDKDGAPQMEVAESIETEDSKTFTVKLKPGLTFSDGQALTAKSFVDAWNFGALNSNAQVNSYFFEPIDGYMDLNPEDPDPTDKEFPKATAETMKGLKVVDDTTFTITLSAPQSSFPARLGYTAFYPLPESAFKDIEAFGEKPIGNGPYVLKAWEHNGFAEFERNAAYKGGDQPQNDGVKLTFYTTPEAAWTDLQGGHLDVIDMVPDSELATYRDDLGERALFREAGVFQSMTFPMYNKVWQGEEGLKRRKAISMAINREEVTDVIFSGTRVPAKDFSSPVVDGFDEGVCGELCTFDAEKAKALMDEAGGFPGTLKIAYNVDGGHQSWVDAVCNQLINSLGIKCEGKPYPKFDALLDDRDNKKMGEYDIFRSGWQMDYPALENFLVPLYAEGAGSNDGFYVNKALDAKLKEAATASDPAQSITLYQDAQRMLVEDPPVVPLWYATANGAFGETVNKAEFNVFGVPIYTEITKKA